MKTTSQSDLLRRHAEEIAALKATVARHAREIAELRDANAAYWDACHTVGGDAMRQAEHRRENAIRAVLTGDTQA